VVAVLPIFAREIAGASNRALAHSPVFK